MKNLSTLKYAAYSDEIAVSSLSWSTVYTLRTRKVHALQRLMSLEPAPIMNRVSREWEALPLTAVMEL